MSPILAAQAVIRQTERDALSALGNDDEAEMNEPARSVCARYSRHQEQAPFAVEGKTLREKNLRNGILAASLDQFRRYTMRKPFRPKPRIENLSERKHGFSVARQNVIPLLAIRQNPPGLHCLHPAFLRFAVVA
jgi:hypothetical protein